MCGLPRLKFRAKKCRGRVPEKLIDFKELIAISSD
jgi:hypothetical protein